MERFLFKKRKKSENIVDKLIQREVFGEPRPATYMTINRSFYQNIVPNLTISNVEKPPCFLRKFSPDGKYFIAFSGDQTSVEIYVYKGCSSINSQIYGISPENVHVYDETAYDMVRRAAFDTIFEKKFTVAVTPVGEQLNRECSLFTTDGHHLIVGAATYVTDDLRPYYHEVYTNNEAVTPNPRSPLEDYSIHIINMKKGDLTDSLTFKSDKICLSHNQGIYLYDKTLAVLSVQHQTIYLYQVVLGKFLPVKTIGQYCYEKAVDQYFLYNTYSTTDDHTELNALVQPHRDNVINGIKHRILAYLFREVFNYDGQDKKHRIRSFYEKFDSIRLLKMWKMQLLDEDHLLIRYASEEVVTLRVAEPNTHLSFFVIYNISSTKVLGFYECTTKEFLELFENYCDYFRNARLPTGRHFMCSPSNNLYSRIAQQRFKNSIICAKFGGHVEARKRILSQLPISAQSYSTSPYLDLSLFTYDEKWVSAMERPKACGEHPIRESGLLKFRIYAGVMGRNPPPAARRLVAFTFHPTEPFAISVQRTNSDYVVNFHLRVPS